MEQALPTQQNMGKLSNLPFSCNKANIYPQATSSIAAVGCPARVWIHPEVAAVA
jgi:hypothetical protein